MKRVLLLAGLLWAGGATAPAGTLVGHLRDLNWYAQYQTQPFGVGYYEFAVNANATNLSSLGGAAGTDVFGVFQMAGLPAGRYTVASWDVWWRSAYAFDVLVPASGTSADVDLRLRATMWGYPAFWDARGYYELGQTFEASGPITMIYLRDPLMQSFTRTVTVREGGPAGGQVGVARTYGGGGDQRLIYGYGQMPTVPGRTYYLRIRTSAAAPGAVLMQMDPRPDFSDPMPGGCLWLGDGTTLTPYPDRDLGVIIMSDDDGLITDLFARSSGGSFSGVSVGQTFVARGVGLISAAFWLGDPAAPTYVVRVLQNGPGGEQVGGSKRGKPARLFADPEMLVTWAPGECPLSAGQTYYLEVTKDGGGAFNSVYVNNGNPFAYGEAFQNGAAVSGTDLAGTIMEEESSGSAARRPLSIEELQVVESVRGTNQLTLRWRTPVSADSRVEYAVGNPPYSAAAYDSNLVQVHSLTVTGLLPHTLYHLRAGSTPTNSNYRAGWSRDIVTVTQPLGSNLLANPGFEEGSGPSPRAVIPGWVKGGGVDIKASDGTWYNSLKPTNGAWFCQGAVNGGISDGYIYQRVSGVTLGSNYTFSAWVMTAPRENGTWKYDVWNAQARLIYMRLGVDPTGGTDPAAGSVQWTPRMYSHLRYTRLAKQAVAQSTNFTVFVSMKGEGVEWHLYAVDDCALTHEEFPTRWGPTYLLTNNRVQLNLTAEPNRSYRLEFTTNLVQWFALTSAFNTNGAVQFNVPLLPSLYPHRFFRARKLP